ncbi:MAG: IclR family transcriptional regulator, partial [Tetrasphaera sp.]|nr:IclR family transcriptional regulator [Tetrasphaera sp.]
AQVRRATFAVNDRQFQDSTVGVAAPVRIGERGDVEAALGIIVAGATSAAVRHLRHPVVSAARAVSRTLGERAGTP